MDLTVVVYLLIAAMAISGGVLGAFWVRALTIMRKRIVDSTAEMERLADLIDRLRDHIEGVAIENDEIRERLERAERPLRSGEEAEVRKDGPA